MKDITKKDVELLVDLLDGTVKMNDADRKSLVYDMRMAILRNRWDGESFAGSELCELKKQIDELEDENTELKEKIDDLQ